MLLRMFGLLPIKAQNMLVDDEKLKGLLAEIYDYLEQHLVAVLVEHDGQESALLLNGLVLLFSVPLLSERKTIFNTLHLVDQLRDDPNRQSRLVNLLLRRLVELKMPIKDQDWTHLLRITRDQTVIVDMLDISLNLEDYWIALEQLTRCSHFAQISDRLIEHLDRFINRSTTTCEETDIV